jgi:hypothetical protein
MPIGKSWKFLTVFAFIQDNMTVDWYYLQVLFVTLCWIWGFNYTFKSGEIFGKIGDWGRKNLNENIISPLYDCPFCMSSVHGTIFYFLFLQPYGWFLWVVFCFALCGFSTMVDKK